MHAVYPPTGQEYAIKIIDKGHLQRNDKLHTAFAEKNALVKLGSGHPGIVRLHRAFRDEWSLCMSSVLFLNLESWPNNMHTCVFTPFIVICQTLSWIWQRMAH